VVPPVVPPVLPPITVGLRIAIGVPTVCGGGVTTSGGIYGIIGVVIGNIAIGCITAGGGGAATNIGTIGNVEGGGATVVRIGAIVSGVTGFTII
jgi:hypothetical protein